MPLFSRSPSSGFLSWIAAGLLAACGGAVTPLPGQSPDGTTSGTSSSSSQGSTTAGTSSRASSTPRGSTGSASSASVAPAVDASVVCAYCVASLRWGYTGGRVAYTSTSALDACVRYTYTRTPSGGGAAASCTEGLSNCASGLAVAITDVNSALADPDVATALSAPAGVYGYDSTPCDGSVLDIHIGNGLLKVGEECPSSGSAGCGLSGVCRPIPAGVSRLAALLVAIDAQELATPECKAVFP
jgi:hypothetical protein